MEIEFNKKNNNQNIMLKSLRKYCICLPRKSSNEMKIFSILLLGLSNSGKTEIGHKLVYERRKDFASTNGVRRFTKCNRYILWNITEIGGSVDMQRIWHYYFVKTMGVIFAIDLSDIKNLPNGFKKLEEIVRHKFIQGKPILILLTKSDLAVGTNISISDIEEFYNLENLANRYKCPMLLEEFSLDDDTGFTKGIQWLDSVIEFNYKILKNRIKFDTNVQSLIQNDSFRKWLPRPFSAPPLRKSKIKKVRPRSKLFQISNDVQQPEIQNNSTLFSEIKNTEKKLKNGRSIELNNVNGDVINTKEGFSQKIDYKVFKNNKVADSGNHKIDIVHDDIENKNKS
ncbi:ADP-ribosylation factor-like protein 13B [Condylostylus longicornis]|uniref:ADP-ribosylation factor-like protein 13B n=1 Tax=Condylostylus longicornis TaxID=2530218 RepID=UPI00244E4244|nr:ADP-ribosylation factor-like protein 13B [Condylostylus longicornis]